jgi:hypothetical protein
MCACVCIGVYVVHVVVHSSSSSPFFSAFPCRPWTRFSVRSASPCFDVRSAYFLPLCVPVPSRNWIDRYALFLSALRLEEEDLFPHCDPVSRVLSHVSPVSRLAPSPHVRETTPLPSAVCTLPIPCSLSSSSFLNHLFARHNISETKKRTNRVVFQHAQRLVHARPLHRAVVPRHRHRDEAHHDGAGLCCCFVSPLFLSISSSHPFLSSLFRKSNPRHPGSALPGERVVGGREKWQVGMWVCTFLRHASGCVAGR